MIAIVNPVLIVKDHIRYLKESANTFILAILFILLPVFLAFVLIKLSIYPSVSFLNALLTAVSIISALMFSLLFIVLDVGRKIKEDLEENKQSPVNWHRYKLLKQLLTNVSFSILLGILIIFVILTTLLLKKYISSLLWLKLLGSVVFYYLLFIYLLTLLQILKRSYILLEHELKIS